MSAKTEIRINTDSQVALNLLFEHINELGDKDKKELRKDAKKLLTTYSNFLYVVQNPEKFQDLK